MVFDRRQDGSGITGCYTLASISATTFCNCFVSGCSSPSLAFLIFKAFRKKYKEGPRLPLVFGKDKKIREKNHSLTYKYYTSVENRYMLSLS